MIRREWSRLCLAILLLASFWIFFHFHRAPLADSDRYFHGVLSRWALESGSWWPKTFPAVTGLKWDERFVDKEPLFHLFTYLGYRLGGESGVWYASFLVACLFLLVFFWYASGRISAWYGALVTFLVFFCHEPFLRFHHVRAFVLGSFALFLLHLGILERRRVWAAVGGGAFALAYHAMYLPLICLGIAFALTWVETRTSERARARRVVWAGLAGLVIGILVNPYFPATLKFSYQIAQIPWLMNHQLQGADFGAELFPLLSNVYFRGFSGLLVVLLVGSLAVGHYGFSREPSPLQSRLYYLWPLTVIFTLITFYSPRGAEYLLPLGGLLLLTLLEQWRAPRRWRGALAAVLLVGGMTAFFLYLRNDQRRPPDIRAEKVAEAVGLVSAAPLHPNIFSCEWESGPMILRRRPDARLLDMLDPSLLYFADPAAFTLKQKLLRGQLPDAHETLRKKFRADYVLCFADRVVLQLLSDPGFQLLYPASAKEITVGSKLPFLFRVREDSSPQFINESSAEFLTGLTTATSRQLRPSAAVAQATATMRGVYSSLAEFNQESSAEKDTRCAWVRPAATELRRLAGANYLGVGGGPSIRVWRNGGLLLESEANFPDARAAQTFARLRPPARADDTWDVLVCGETSNPLWGIGLSLWTERDFAEVCSWKRGSRNPDNKWVAGSLTSMNNETCLGGLAYEGLPPLLRGLQRELRVSGMRP